ncbi:hypothetical protein HBZS_100220 [Helicobacter bizzozeronii CCUG 35545]|nr:hypothetical protein HBZS_100220 [Helicobacter bizzozeronii CCUG 35545]
MGSFLLKWIDDRILMGVFVVVVCYTFIKYAFSHADTSDHSNAHFKMHSKPQNFTATKSFTWGISEKHGILALAGLITGIFSIPLGMGGGILMVPFLGYFLKYSTQKIVPLGLFFCDLFLPLRGHLFIPLRRVRRSRPASWLNHGARRAAGGGHRDQTHFTS